MHTVYRCMLMALTILGLEALSIWSITRHHHWTLEISRNQSLNPIRIQGEGQLLSLSFSKFPKSEPVSFFEMLSVVDHVDEHHLWGLDFRRTVMRPDWYDVDIKIAFAWLVFLPLLIPVLAAVRFIYRKVTEPRKGHCVRCGYDLRASPDQCPECGKLVEKKPPETSLATAP